MRHNARLPCEDAPMTTGPILSLRHYRDSLIGDFAMFRDILLGKISL
jgi:hypothetical protein